jgi:hypothetical protein
MLSFGLPVFIYSFGLRGGRKICFSIRVAPPRLLLQMRSTPLLNSSRTRKENLPFGARHKRFVSKQCMPLVQVKVANLSARCRLCELCLFLLKFLCLAVYLLSSVDK